MLAIEGDRTACKHAGTNLAGLPGVRVECGAVELVLGGPLPSTFDQVDLVVLDPPREGAKASRGRAGRRPRNPRAIAYVACDPAALGRDVATFAKFGYQVRKLRALDMFPMTHHVECVALLTR